jgi:hypothetical protein
MSCPFDGAKNPTKPLVGDGEVPRPLHLQRYLRDGEVRLRGAAGGNKRHPYLARTHTIHWLDLMHEARLDTSSSSCHPRSSSSSYYCQYIQMLLPYESIRIGPAH